MIYIIGSNGYIAKKIKKLIPKSNLTCISTKKTKDSIKTHIFKKKINEKWITKINEHDVIFFLSSFGNIDFHEKNTKLINQSLRNIESNFFSKINSKSKIIFFSSDMVYGGNKNYFLDNSQPSPKNEYGKTKVRIEKIIRSYFKNHLILRISKIYSNDLRENTFIKGHIEKLKSNKKVYLFSDNKYHYTNVKFLLKILKKIFLAKKNIIGTYNLPSGKVMSRYDLIKSFLIKFNKMKLIKKIEKISLKRSKIKLPIKLSMKTNLYKILKLNFI